MALAATFFQANRARFLLMLGNDAALIGSPPQHHRNGDSEYRYRQASDLYYLTGWEDPECLVLLRPGAAEPFIMFVQPRDPERETWTGRRVGPEGAVALFGADAAYPFEDAPKRLPELLIGYGRLHHRFGADDATDRLVTRSVESARRAARKSRRDVPEVFIDHARGLHELRLRKSPEEIAVMRASAQISKAAHTKAMEATRPGVFEYELEAAIDGTFRAQGGSGPGYTTIVAGGDNATILHYVTNRDALRDGDLVCVDAGAELDCYTTDVTRTWPVSGRFNAAQRRAYQVVLDAQLNSIEAAKPGAPFIGVHDASVRTLTQGMVDLGLLSGQVDELIASEAFKKYYMHGTSHWLGLDVHDAGNYHGAGVSRELEAGMVLTVEPGLYIRTDDLSAPPELRGIGIRIEDDVLITATGNDVLTAGIPKTIEEIEATVGRSPRR